MNQCFYGYSEYWHPLFLGCFHYFFQELLNFMSTNDKIFVGFDIIRCSFVLFVFFFFQIALYNSHSWAIFMQLVFTAFIHWKWKGCFGLLVLLIISHLAKFFQIPLKPQSLSASQKGTASEGKRNKSLWNANGVKHFLPFQEIIYPFGKFVKGLALMKIF